VNEMTVMPTVVLLCCALTPAWAQEADPFARWEPGIAAFEAQDKADPPPEGGIVFVGSSSIVGWNLAKHFPDLPAINRGFGGSKLADSVHFADRIVVPYKPRLIVLYAGDNDIAAGASPEAVAADYAAFLAAVRAELPEVWVAFIAIKPSLARWALVDKMREANALVRGACDADPNAVFVDIHAPMLGADGRPREELFKEDGLHLSEEGYALWSSVLRPYLGAGVWVTEESGLRYTDIRIGEGPFPQAGQTVAAHYEGRLADGAKFDASRDHGTEPLQFAIGVGQVIRGWDEGLLTMRVGGIRRLVIPPQLGYGDPGIPGVIPPRATLTFSVELVGVSGEAGGRRGGPGE